MKSDIVFYAKLISLEINDFNYQQHIYLYTCIKKELNRKVSKRLGEGEITSDFKKISVE